MGWNNPPIPWAELEARLSGGSVPTIRWIPTGHG